MREITDNRLSLEWFKSSYSDTSNPNDCVEVAVASGAVHVRDSKNVDGPRLAVARRSWSSFVAYASER
ncbi:DUF397 domain-containing protein [Streptomyces sp. enrichment culture]|uniref:DUF397 domain-containing protein n=1 Tax=Streptomyces sp. enrichment culture TaxID=1795815 RepID=UPI003F567F50